MPGPKHFTLAAVVLVLVCDLPSAAQQTSSPSPTPVNLDQLYGGFLGDWVGQLEYRDFGDNSRVFLPTWLHITRSNDGRSLRFAYVYDDGPSKTVQELSVVTIDRVAAAITFTSDRDHSSDTYKLSGLSEFAAKGRGALALAGTGEENGKKVDVKITITLRRNLYTYQKETRLPGQDFQFRDGYTFTRKEPPE